MTTRMHDRTRAEPEPRPSPTGRCHDCGVFITGDRLYCGKDAARRDGDVRKERRRGRARKMTPHNGLRADRLARRDRADASDNVIRAFFGDSFNRLAKDAVGAFGPLPCADRPELFDPDSLPSAPMTMREAERTVIANLRAQIIGDAKALCAECPIRDACLEYAMRPGQPEHYPVEVGIWGGLTERERRALHKAPVAP